MFSKIDGTFQEMIGADDDVIDLPERIFDLNSVPFEPEDPAKKGAAMNDIKKSESLKTDKKLELDSLKKQTSIGVLNKLRKAEKFFAEKLEHIEPIQEEPKPPKQNVEDREKKSSKLVVGTVELNYDKRSAQQETETKRLQEQNQSVQNDLNEKNIELGQI